LETQIQTAVQQPGFAPALGMRIATLVKDGIEKASIRLNPAEMGPVAVKLALEGTQVRVEMSAELAATRQVLEQSLPSLAGALREAGFTLSGGGVFQQHPDRPQGDGETRRNPSGDKTSLGLDEATEALPTSRPVVRTAGLVDLFA
jgi:flagellar hook-length control protein FliK